MFAFNMMASGVNAFQAAAPKLDVIHERAKKTVNQVRRSASLGRTKSLSNAAPDTQSMNVETGRGALPDDEDDGAEGYTYRRSVRREYSPEQPHGRREHRRRIERRRSDSLDSEASISPPRRIQNGSVSGSASRGNPINQQLVVRHPSNGSPSSRSKKSRSASVSSSSSLPNSSEDEREHRKKKRAAQVMTGVSAIATVNAAANFWLSVKASHERDAKLKEGKMTEQEAKKEKLKNQAQDIASIGAAVLTVKVVRNRWKMTKDQNTAAEKHKEERRERRAKRAAKEKVEWEFEDLGTETESEYEEVRKSSRPRRPAMPQRLLSYSDDEYDRRPQRSFNERYAYRPQRNPAPSVHGGSVHGSAHGSNSGRVRQRSRKHDSSDDETYVEHAYYDMGYEAKEHPDDKEKEKEKRRDRAQSAYGYDDRRRYDDYCRRDRDEGRRDRSRGGRDRREKDDRYEYKESRGRNDAMMNLGNF